MPLDAATLSQLRETVRRFVRERLIPNERKVEESDAIPPDIVADMRALGLFGLTIPEEYGGLGLNTEEEVQIVYEIAQASSAYRSCFASTIGIGSQGIVIDGTPEQRAKYLPRMAKGELIGSFALTEPDIGSDAAHLKLSARRDGGDFVLNGTKRFITNAPEAGLFTVMARSNPDEAGAKGITAFLVEAGTPGLRLGKIDRKLGHHGSHTSDVIFEDVRVPAVSIIGGKEGQGFTTAMRVLDRGRLHIAAACCGAAERLIEMMLDYAVDRVQFGKPIAEHQLVQGLIADSKRDSYVAWCALLDACRRRDAGGPVTSVAACVKYFASEMVWRVADAAVQIHGGNGYMLDYRVEQFLRDVRLYRLYEGTSQIQQLIIARELLKEHSRTR
ncbi:MAG TPA: acyl-CoA dehydrogenase family protein [Pseudolabrys sp.]|nr:acyl-CoA dehydrogenase family protein [Pseudolabrys sp.]